MGRVFVAGSINMDVVATADRHPRVGETVAGNAVHYFPGGKGANQAVAAAKLGAPTTLIGRLGTDAFGQQLRTFLGRARRRPRASSRTPPIPIPARRSSRSPMPTTPSSSCPAPMRWSAPTMSPPPALAKGDVAVSQFEIPLATIAAFFKRARAAGATTILNPAPAHRLSGRSCSISSISSCSTRPSSGLLAEHRASRERRAARFVEAARRCRPARTRSSASRWASAACSRWSAARPR